MFDWVTYSANYYKKHRDKILAYSKAYNKAHPKRKAELQKEHRFKHPAYVNWRAMIDRVYNINHPAYKYYGGRGIIVCERWKTFKHFYKDFGYSKPGKGYTVDRINNNGNYEFKNVQWLTKADNVRRKFLND